MGASARSIIIAMENVLISKNFQTRVNFVIPSKAKSTLSAIRRAVETYNHNMYTSLTVYRESARGAGKSARILSFFVSCLKVCRFSLKAMALKILYE